MTARTRYFVIVSLLVLGVGLGTGLVAYYVGFPAGAFARAGGPDELQFVPRDATLIAYADVRELMTSELRQKLHAVIPVPAEGQRDFEEKTGINIETDIDRVVACLNPNHAAQTEPSSGMVLARGRFNETKIESLMREHGAQVDDYQPREFAAAFLEPGLVALGSAPLVRSAIDLHQTGDNPQAGLQSVTGNEELMNLVKSLESGNNFWAVGRFDALQTQAHLPQEVTTRLPAITWFAASGHVNSGLRGTLRAEARDEDAANNLRDVVRGFLALGKMQAGSRPDIQAMMQSLELSGTGKTVEISFVVPAAVFDVIGDVHNQRPRKPADR
jgi:hypothetical protein